MMQMMAPPCTRLLVNNVHAKQAPLQQAHKSFMHRPGDQGLPAIIFLRGIRCSCAKAFSTSFVRLPSSAGRHVRRCHPAALQNDDRDEPPAIPMRCSWKVDAMVFHGPWLPLTLCTQIHLKDQCHRMCIACMAGMSLLGRTQCAQAHRAYVYHSTLAACACCLEVQ